LKEKTKINKKEAGNGPFITVKTIKQCLTVDSSHGSYTAEVIFSA